MADSDVVSLQWEGIPALELRAGETRALLLPGFGGHLISLDDKRTSYLRKPRNLGEYLILPEAFGLPVLFPPNRIEGCRFEARGQKYLLPANKGNQHLHGFLYQRPWQVDRIAAENGGAEIGLSFTSPAGGEVYRWFPHPFRARLIYRLEEGRLSQEVFFENSGDKPMPLMLGFHTAFALPDREKSPEAYRIRIALGDIQHEAGPPMTDFRSGRILKKGEKVFGQFLAGSFTGEDGRLFHGAVIENVKTGGKLYYQTDEQFAYWVLWNQDGNDSFLCIEPQTCAINAANMHQEKDLFGFKMLDAGAVFKACNLLSFS
ncbi:galactose mutarotase [Spirochaetia bacterium]|nr:galactose mutarotase [Spirochaetia bacterium]